jgi:hypothetical protein
MDAPASQAGSSLPLARESSSSIGAPDIEVDV